MILGGVERPDGSWLGHGVLCASVLEDGVRLSDLRLTVPEGAWEASWSLVNGWKESPFLFSRAVKMPLAKSDPRPGL